MKTVKPITTHYNPLKPIKTRKSQFSYGLPRVDLRWFDHSLPGKSAVIWRKPPMWLEDCLIKNIRQAAFIGDCPFPYLIIDNGTIIDCNSYVTISYDMIISVIGHYIVWLLEGDYPLVICSIAIENGHRNTTELVSFPSHSMLIFQFVFC